MFSAHLIQVSHSHISHSETYTANTCSQSPHAHGNCIVATYNCAHLIRTSPNLSLISFSLFLFFLFSSSIRWRIGTVPGWFSEPIKISLKQFIIETKRKLFFKSHYIMFFFFNLLLFLITIEGIQFYC